ncbi:MAG: hypothetical protein QNJ94_14875 [Alphaproteobacteria bacterium]|nr:hypothetical protein [Alphaproteobacteria bacterium]
MRPMGSAIAAGLAVAAFWVLGAAGPAQAAGPTGISEHAPVAATAPGLRQAEFHRRRDPIRRIPVAPFRRTIDISAQIVGPDLPELALEPVIVFAERESLSGRTSVVGRLRAGEQTRIHLDRTVLNLEFQTAEIRKRLVLPGSRFLVVQVEIEIAPDGVPPAGAAEPPRARVVKLTPRIVKSN